MYGNMTREEMIQRLYEGNFTTGELERQLIAKLFEQCCGGGGSSGGGAFVTYVTIEESNNAESYTMDKTAAEVFEAAKAGPVYAMLVLENEDETEVVVRAVKDASYESGDDSAFYSFVVESFSGSGTMSFTTDSGSDYPIYTRSGGGGGAPTD